MSSVSTFVSVVWPRAVKTMSNLVCGRLISARIELTSTDVGDLLRRSDRHFPPLGVVVLVVVAFWIGCGLLALRVVIPMVAVLDDFG